MFYVHRFWYEKEGVFTPAQLTELRHTSLARIICENADAIQHIQPDVFQRVDYPGGYVDCEGDLISRMDFKVLGSVLSW